VIKESKVRISWDAERNQEKDEKRSRHPGGYLSAWIQANSRLDPTSLPISRKVVQMEDLGGFLSLG
jgi:hypothetical protein